eukprot:3277228-Prymnesium_polylepis.1
MVCVQRVYGKHSSRPPTHDVGLKHAAGGPASMRPRRPRASLPPHTRRMPVSQTSRHCVVQERRPGANGSSVQQGVERSAADRLRSRVSEAQPGNGDASLRPAARSASCRQRSARSAQRAFGTARWSRASSRDPTNQHCRCTHAWTSTSSRCCAR